jgi:hypothetical protein
MKLYNLGTVVWGLYALAINQNGCISHHYQSEMNLGIISPLFGFI